MKILMTVNAAWRVLTHFRLFGEAFHAEGHNAIFDVHGPWGDLDMVHGKYGVFSVLCIRNFPHKWTTNPSWNWGFFSCSIYIFHIAFIFLSVLIPDQGFSINAADIESYWAWVLFLPIVLLGTWGMYFLGEKQCNGLLKRMARARPRALA